MPRRTKNQDILAVETAIEQHVAARVRLRRGLLGMSQSDLARRLGITFQQVQKYEQATNRISIGKLVQIAQVLDVPITFFFDGIDVPGIRDPSALVQPVDPESPGVLGRRELELVRAWRATPPVVADAFSTLLRVVSREGAAEADAT